MARVPYLSNPRNHDTTIRLNNEELSQLRALIALRGLNQSSLLRDLIRTAHREALGVG